MSKNKLKVAEKNAVISRENKLNSKKNREKKQKEVAICSRVVKTAEMN